MSVAALTPYTGRRWRIRGRIVSKSDVRTFNGARGPGKLFKIDISDRSGEISATFWGQSVDDHFDRLEMNKVYYFSGGTVKAGNPRFDKGVNVITFDANTQIEEAAEDSSIPGLTFNFTSIAEIQSLPANTIVDVQGILSEALPKTTITMKSDGRLRSKRSLILWDSSGQDGSAHVEFTVWGERADAEYAPETTFFLKGARVSEWNNMKQLGTVGSTMVLFELPGRPAAGEELRQAWAASGQPSPPAGLRGGSAARRATVQELHEENLNLGPAPEPGQPLDQNGPSSIHRHQITGTITTVFTDRPPYYPACSQQVDDGKGKQRSCNKKLMDEGGGWRCANGHVCEQPSYRYILRARVADHTGVLEVSTFDEAGRTLFGCDAGELAAIWDDEARSEELQLKLKRPYWQRCILNVRSQREIFQDEERVKVSAQEVQNADLVKEAKRRLLEIHTAVGPAESLVGSPKNGGA